MDLVVGQEPLSLFSKQHIPLAGRTIPHYHSYWFGGDSEERYKQRPHPSLGREDVIYSFNSRGYRCPEFYQAQGLKEKAIKVVSIGASEVFGFGLPEDQTFPSQFCKLLENNQHYPVINWNLGLSGASSDYVSRILVSALPVLKPDIVLLVFPMPIRREHLGDVGRLFTYPNPYGSNVIEKIKNTLKYRLLDPENASQNSAYKALSSHYNDQVNLFKNYQVCEALCEKNGVIWCFSSYRSDYFSQLGHLIDTSRLLTPGLINLRNKYIDNPAIGLARDMEHPGIKPNQEMAELFFERLKSLYSTRMRSR